MNPQFKKGVLELCVLSLVAHRDYYGYELVDEISQKIEITEGTIYPILRRLTDDKLFETYLRESNAGPPRKYYRITKRGAEACSILTEEWNAFQKSVDKILKTGDKK